MTNHHQPGHNLALLGSIMLLTSAAILLGIVATALGLHFFEGRPFDYLLHASPIPAIALLTWLCTVGGSAASIVAIVVYGYRAHWFWRCLVASAALWLLAPPIHFVIGLISLIVLISLRKAFPPGHPVSDAP